MIHTWSVMVLAVLFIWRGEKAMLLTQEGKAGGGYITTEENVLRL